MKSLLIALAVPPQGRGRPADRPRAEMIGMSAGPRDIAGLGLFTLAMVALIRWPRSVGSCSAGPRKHALIAALTERSRRCRSAAAILAVERTHAGAATNSAASVLRQPMNPVRMRWSIVPAPPVRNRYLRPRNLGLSCRRACRAEDRRDQCGALRKHHAGSWSAGSRSEGARHQAPVTLTGYIRFPEKAGMLTPAENVAKRLCSPRDHFSMARALGWGEVAPFYIDLEPPGAAGGIPKPGPTGGPSQGRSPAIRHSPGSGSPVRW